MHPSPCSANISPPEPAVATAQPNETAGRAYQAVTIIAMLLLLGSLGLFW
ncbi:MAG: hypothetical protein WBC92_19750 [Terracidiphilus sp.]